jgi:aspartyl-tRNA(Asn)/glutamyl-tRNA(Gln) amidotransferase subunit C
MSVSKKEVEAIAVLARLEFSESDKEKMIGELNTILSYVSQLNEVDTSNIEPLINMGDRTNVLRDDVLVPSVPNAEALKNAPDFQDRFFKVPKVIA